MAYTLIGSLISPFARKVAVVLSEKGLAYELDDVNPFAPPADFASVSPLGKIPVLRDGDRVVNDSTVICRYLERRQPQPPLYPADPYDCARAEWLEEYIDGLGELPDPEDIEDQGLQRQLEQLGYFGAVRRED